MYAEIKMSTQMPAKSSIVSATLSSYAYALRSVLELELT